MKDIQHNPHLQYRPDIDGLRAIAILLVIIFHAFPHFLRGGFVGVDIFFVISGYLITSIILKGLSQNKFSLLDFYSRRIKRIFPALIVVLSFCLLSGWSILLADEYELLGKHIAGGAVYISNFVLESEAGYFDTDAKYKPLLHLWSLSIEEQFYLLFPLLLILAFRFNANKFFVILSFLTVSFLINIFAIKDNPTQVFYYPHTRAWELLIGSCVSYINLYSRSHFEAVTSKFIVWGSTEKEKTLANLLAWLGFVFILIAWISFDHEKILFPGGWALLPALGAAFLILAGEQAWLNKSILANKVIVFIGLISYPLYLWHWPLLSLTNVVEMENPSSGLRLSVLLLSVFLAWLTYYFIEKNLRYREHWIIPVGLLTSLIIVGALGLQVKLEQGYNSRFFYSTQLSQGIGLKPWQAAGWVKQTACLNRFGQYEFCLLQKDKQPISAMLIGDSHANHLYPGLIQNPSLKNQNLLNLGMGACLHFINSDTPILNNQGKHCQSLINNALEFAIKTPSVKTVILAGAWSGALQKKKKKWAKFWHRFSADVVTSTQDEAVTNFQDSMRKTLAALTQAEKKVIFVVDIPPLGFNPSNCTQRPWRISGELVKKPCASLRTDFEHRMQEYHPPIMKILADFPQVQVWNPIHAFCDKRYCWAVKNGTMLYRDENHLNEAGSLYVGSFFHLQ